MSNFCQRKPLLEFSYSNTDNYLSHQFLKFLHENCKIDISKCTTQDVIDRISNYDNETFKSFVQCVFGQNPLHDINLNNKITLEMKGWKPYLENWFKQNPNVKDKFKIFPKSKKNVNFHI